jgi:pimeloyl-ACP methyl ester carboxylesterase
MSAFALIHALVWASVVVRPVIIAPAQFGVPKDYTSIATQLEARGHRVFVAPLTRFSWLRIAPATFTPAFWQGALRPVPTLNFYFEALDACFAAVDKECGPDTAVTIIGHSIGGWAVRAYLGERMGEERVRRRVARVVTLGTPHNPPPLGSALAKVDQTRGLLSYINKAFPFGSPLDPEQIVCVAGSATTTSDLSELTRSAVWDGERRRSKLLERLVALPSYAALCGAAFGVQGDGLIPIQTALLGGGCKSLILEGAHHSGFIPTALDSIQLPDEYAWYGSPEQLAVWAEEL